jgi:hypothetical protein
MQARARPPKTTFHRKPFQLLQRWDFRVVRHLQPPHYKFNFTPSVRTTYKKSTVTMAGFKVKGAVIQSMTPGLWAGCSISEQCNYVATLSFRLSQFVPGWDISRHAQTSTHLRLAHGCCYSRSSCVVLSVEFAYLPNAQSAILYNWA